MQCNEEHWHVLSLVVAVTAVTMGDSQERERERERESDMVSEQ
jgi:hypothetical protein